jgi:hypothetical protein
MVFYCTLIMGNTINCDNENVPIEVMKSCRGENKLYAEFGHGKPKRELGLETGKKETVAVLILFLGKTIEWRRGTISDMCHTRENWLVE